MEIAQYQKEAFATDETKRATVSLYGLVGEVGTIFSVCKKRLRDRQNFAAFREELTEELGDALWYLASVASVYEISLEEVAAKNLAKAKSMFEEVPSPEFDAGYLDSEKLPRHMRIRFVVDPKTGRSQMIWEDAPLGSSLSDNADKEDYYRFHDVFHLAFMAHLHWSPVMRGLLKRKRKSNSAVDDNEDGARAAITEEAISALIFNVAEDHDFFTEIRSIPFSLLKTIARLAAKFEVRGCTAKHWQQAIWQGAAAYRELKEHRGGVVEVDLDEPRLAYLAPP